jgi:hypothetical protein
MRIILVLVAMCLTSVATCNAAALTCGKIESKGFTLHGCSAIKLTGRIEKGDAISLEVKLLENYPVRDIVLISPGGDLYEGMEIGRIIRSNFMTAHARNVAFFGDPVDSVVRCVSSCALAYFGAVRWLNDDIVAVHRPTLKDLESANYDESAQALRNAGDSIQKYLSEMDIENKIFELLMKTSPDTVAPLTARTVAGGYDVLHAYPRSVYDWLAAKCKGRLGSGFCIDDRFTDEESRRHDILEYIESEDGYMRLKTKAQLSAILSRTANSKDSTAIRLRGAASTRLESYRLEESGKK